MAEAQPGRAAKPIRPWPLWSALSLSQKMGIALASAGFLIFGAIALIISAIVSQEFTAIERTELSNGVARTSAYLTGLAAASQKRSNDWALSTDSFEFIKGKNQGFISENINADAAAATGVDTISYVRFDKRPVLTVFYDRETATLDREMTRGVEAAVSTDAMIAYAKSNPKSAFYLRVGGKQLAAGITQITRSDGSGTPEGFLMMARELRPGDLRQALKIDPVLDTAIDLSPGVRLNDTDMAEVRVGLYDHDSRQIGSVTYNVERSLLAAGQQLQKAMIAGVALLIVILVLVLGITLRRIVIAPLRNLESHVTEIGRTGELAEIRIDERRDEIGSLTTGFNEMIAQLVDLRTRLERQSFILGKNQNVIGSMHNVKNGLSPVTTMLSLIPQKLGFAGKADLARALGELASPETEAVRRQQLAAFASATVDNLVGQIESARELASEASRSLAQAVETLTHDRASNETSSDDGHCDLTAVVAAGLSIATYNDQGAAIAIDYVDEQKRLTGGNRVLITQIVGNVLTNAVEAIVASGRQDGQITVRGETVSHGGVTMEQLVITDNGDGFDRDVAAQLFERGFSTRDHKDGGLGLHWSANTLGAMGGVLSLHSDGKGKGATVRVAIPAASQAAPDISQAA